MRRTSRCRATIWCLVATLLAARTAVPRVEAAERGPDAFHGIRVESFSRTVGDAYARMQVTVRSDTPVNSAWDILRNVDRWDAFMGLFPETDLIEATESYKRIRMVVSPPWPLKQFPCVVEARERPEARLIEWSVKEGKLKGNTGTIVVEGADGGSRIVYESVGPSRNAFPNWAVRIGVRVVLPGLLKDFYRQARGLAEEPGERGER